MGMAAGMPSCVMFNAVLQKTCRKVIVVCILAGRFGSSNRSSGKHSPVERR